MGFEVQEPFHVRAKSIRLKRGISQEAAADAIDTERSSLAHIELGDRNPSIDRVIALANLYSVTPLYLLGLLSYDDDQRLLGLINTLELSKERDEETAVWALLAAVRDCPEMDIDYFTRGVAVLLRIMEQDLSDSEREAILLAMERMSR